MGTNVFKLNSNNQYEIARIIPSVEEVKQQVPHKILDYFDGDPNAENKIHRIGITNPADTNFVAYNLVVTGFIAVANAQIAANDAYLTGLQQVTTGDGAMQQKIYIME
jgi:hypothetical protein